MKGTVYISDDNNNLDIANNRITSTFLKNIVKFWGAWDQDQADTLAPAIYCAVGAGNENPDFTHTATSLEKEAKRLVSFSQSLEPVTNRTRISTIFRGSDANFDWKEIGLFSAEEVVYTLERCESSTSSTWTTIDVNDLRYVSDSLVVQDTGSVILTGDLTNPRVLLEITDLGKLAAKSSNGHLVSGIVGSDQANIFLQFFLLLDSPSSFTGPIVANLSNYGDSGYNGWKWQILPSELEIGWNFISLNMLSGQISGDITKPITKFRLSSASAGGIRVWGIDELRLFRNSGNLLARIVLESPISKTFGESKTVTWVIDPLGAVP